MIEGTLICTFFCWSKVLVYNLLLYVKLVVFSIIYTEWGPKIKRISCICISCSLEPFLLIWGLDVNHSLSVFLLYTPCLSTIFLPNSAENSFSFLLPSFPQHSAHPALTGLSFFSLPVLSIYGLEYVLCCTLSPLMLPNHPWLCEFNEGSVVVGVVSYLRLIFQLSAVGLVYHFPDAACIRVSWRLLLRAVISFSEVHGSSGRSCFPPMHLCHRVEHT